MKNSKLYFSIIIPCLNEEKYIPKLLSDLAQQSFSKQFFEVIVVDGSSQDQTVAKVNRYKNKLNLTVLNSKLRNVGHQRNLGAKKTRSEWIVFMDADNRIPPYYLDGVKYQIAKHPSTDLFTTWLRADSQYSVDQSIAKALNFAIELYKTINHPMAVGALIGCKATIFSKIQFDERQKFLEDGLFVKSASEMGFHFSIFREPLFTLSYRRFRKEGKLKSIRTAAMLQLKYFLKKDFQDETRYPMLGGEYYSGPNKTSNMLVQLQNFIQQASEKQTQQARKLFNSLRDEL